MNSIQPHIIGQHPTTEEPIQIVLLQFSNLSQCAEFLKNAPIEQSTILSYNTLPFNEESSKEFCEQTLRKYPIAFSFVGTDAEKNFSTETGNLFIDNPANPTVFKPDNGLDYVYSAIKDDTSAKKGGVLK